MAEKLRRHRGIGCTSDDALITTGSILPLERRRALVEVAQRFGVPIFEDECYADLL